MKENTNKGTSTKICFLENPYDIETVFEALSVASDSDMELLFMDRFIHQLRQEPDADITNMLFTILKSLKEISLNTSTPKIKHSKS